MNVINVPWIQESEYKQLIIIATNVNKIKRIKKIVKKNIYNKKINYYPIKKIKIRKNYIKHVNKHL